MYRYNMEPIRIEIKTRPCDICHKGLTGITKDDKAECFTCSKKKYGIGN